MWSYYIKKPFQAMVDISFILKASGRMDVGQQAIRLVPFPHPLSTVPVLILCCNILRKSIISSVFCKLIYLFNPKSSCFFSLYLISLYLVGVFLRYDNH